MAACHQQNKLRCSAKCKMHNNNNSYLPAGLTNGRIIHCCICNGVLRADVSWSRIYQYPQFTANNFCYDDWWGWFSRHFLTERRDCWFSFPTKIAAGRVPYLGYHRHNKLIDWFGCWRHCWDYETIKRRKSAGQGKKYRNNINMILRWYGGPEGTTPFKTNSQPTKYILLQTQN